MDLNPRLEGFYNKSLDALQRKQFDYAVELLKTVIAEAPLYAPAYRGLHKAAILRLDTKKINPLERFAAAALAQSYLWLGHIHGLRNAPEAAFRAYVQGVILTPHHGGLLLAWFQTALKMKCLDIAIIAAEALSQETPPREEIFLRLADLYLEKGDPTQAKQTMQRGLRLLPSSPRLVRRFKEVEAERTMKEGDWTGKN